MYKFSYLLSIMILGFSIDCYGFITASTSSVSMNPSDIYTVVATPIEANSTYKLEVFREGDASAVMTVARPLDGSIVDIVISDVDYDGEEELAVFMQEAYSQPKKLHFDVFEFGEHRLNWVENFFYTDSLLSLFYKGEIKK